MNWRVPAVSLVWIAWTACAERDAAPQRDTRDAAVEAAPVRLPDPDSTQPFWLSATGLYRDIAHKELAADLHEFEPRFALWSDAAHKRRWLRLPEGARIDSSDPEHWQFPVGTMVFKEFMLDDRRLETRLIARTGPGHDDYWMGAFAWNEDESDARWLPEGAQNVRGTEHDVPKRKQCFTCHDGEPGRVLGFSALQQPDLQRNMLTDAVPAPRLHDELDALGYLHANCAHCHNPTGSARPDTDMNMRLSLDDARPEDTSTYRTTVGVAMQYFEHADAELRVQPGDAAHSGVLVRMSDRGPKTQMPPLATEQVDAQGIAAVRSWIERL